VPAMAKRPPSGPIVNSMSASAASRKWAAAFFPRAMTSSAASMIAAPLAISDFDPPVPPPAINSSLSPCKSRTRPRGIPRREASTWAKGVAWP